MSDLLDVLSGLRVGPDSRPESIERLRERIVLRRRRRRRRSALVGSLSLAVLAAAVLVVAVDGEGGSTLRTVDDPTTVPSTVGPGLSSPLPVGSVISSASGIEQVAESGDLVRLSDEPAARAFAIRDLVVWQGGEAGAVYPLPRTGPVLVLDGGDQRALPAELGEELTLHDVGVVEGRAVAVVTAQRGTSPEDTDERLLLVDLETNDRTDVGSVGGWESGVSRARLVGDRIVTLAAVSVEQRVVVRSLDGAVVWEAAEPVVDGIVGLAVDGEQVLQIEPIFVGDDFDPQLDITRYELSAGAPTSTESIALQLTNGLEIEGGFCNAPEASAGQLVCDQSDGPPIVIDLDTGETTVITGIDAGVPTLPREPFTRPVGSTADSQDPGSFDATFDPPVGVPGGLVTLTLTFTGLEELAGTEVDLGISTPNGERGDGVGSGRINNDGVLVVDMSIPNVIEHEYQVSPGRYTITVDGKVPNDGLRLELPMDIESAQIGVPYRHQPGYTCPDYMWFDQRLWIAAPASPLDWSAGAPPGIFELASRDRASFAIAADIVDYRAATSEERAAFDPEMFQCPP
jgi:hypothetical protein